VHLCVPSVRVPEKSGFILRRAVARRGRASRTGRSTAAWLWANVGAAALAAVFSVFTPATAAAAPPGRQFYVDSLKGSDSSNAGTSSTSPWQSLTKVNGTPFQAGDVVNFKRGSTWSGTLVVSGSWVTYQAYGDAAEAPHIEGPGVNYGHAVEISGSNNVVQGFRITGAHEAGVIIKAGAHDNLVQHNEITNTGTGVMIRGQYNRAAYNHVHDLRMIVNDKRRNTDYGAVCFWLEAANNEIDHNTGIECKAESSDFGYDGGFVEVWKNGSNSKIHHNYAENTNGFFELGAGDGSGSAHDIVVAYNVIVNVTGPGSGTSVCFNTGRYNIDVTNFRFDNNTFVSTEGTPDAYRVFGCGKDLSHVTLRNNIFYSDIQIANTGNFTHTNNLYYNMVNMKSGFGVGYVLDETETLGDPLFAKPGFHLGTGSPAINLGTDLGYLPDADLFALDFAGTTVPQCGKPDAGAYESTQCPKD
jgi:hypothetical protein